MSLLNENKAEIAYNDDYYWSKDPHLVHTFAEAGTYYLRIYGTGESGSAAADYRLIAGEMPHVDYAMPLGGKRGESVDIHLRGVNLGGVDGAVLGDQQARGKVVSRSDKESIVRMKIPVGLATGVYRLHVDHATLPVSFVVPICRRCLRNRKRDVPR